MAVSEKAKQLMENADFQAKLEKAQDFDEYKAVFAAEGIDFEAEFSSDGDEGAELSAEDLDNVAGGISNSDVIRIVKNAYKVVKGGPVRWFKFGASAGILLRAYTDMKIYGNPTRSYSAQEIEWAGKSMGCY